MEHLEVPTKNNEVENNIDIFDDFIEGNYLTENNFEYCNKELKELIDKENNEIRT
jgi:hypothetical protein